MVALNRVVAAGPDDAHETASGASFNRTDTKVRCDSDFLGPSFRFNAGFRFTDITIPAGATISSALLTVQPFDTSHDDANVDIKGEDVDDAADFATTGDVTSRIRTTASVLWREDTVPAGGQSPNFAAVVQEIVDRAGWASGNAIVILLDGKADLYKQFWPAAFEHATLAPVEIDINYTAGAAVVTGSATLSGIGQLQASSLLEIPGAATLSGIGQLQANSLILVLGTAALTGSGMLVADALVLVLGAATLTGNGMLIADGVVIPSGSGVVVLGAAILVGAGSAQGRGYRIIAFHPGVCWATSDKACPDGRIHKFFSVPGRGQLIVEPGEDVPEGVFIPSLGGAHR